MVHAPRHCATVCYSWLGVDVWRTPGKDWDHTGVGLWQRGNSLNITHLYWYMYNFNI